MPSHILDARTTIPVPIKSGPDPGLPDIRTTTFQVGPEDIDGGDVLDPHGVVVVVVIVIIIVPCFRI